MVPTATGSKAHCVLQSQALRFVWAGAGPQHEYSWHPHLPEARHAGCRRPGVRRVWAGAGPQRVARTGAHRGSLLPTACSSILISTVNVDK